MAGIKVSYTLQEEDQFLCNISLRLFHGYGLHYNTKVKGLKNCPGAIFHSGSLFTLLYMVMDCNYYNTRSKRFKEVLLSRRKTSFYAKFQVNCLPFFTWLWPAL